MSERLKELLQARPDLTGTNSSPYLFWIIESLHVQPENEVLAQLIISYRGYPPAGVVPPNIMEDGVHSVVEDAVSDSSLIPALDSLFVTFPISRHCLQPAKLNFIILFGECPVASMQTAAEIYRNSDLLIDLLNRSRNYIYLGDSKDLPWGSGRAVALLLFNGLRGRNYRFIPDTAPKLSGILNTGDESRFQFIDSLEKVLTLRRLPDALKALYARKDFVRQPDVVGKLPNFDEPIPTFLASYPYRLMDPGHLDDQTIPLPGWKMFDGDGDDKAIARILLAETGSKKRQSGILH